MGGWQWSEQYRKYYLTDGNGVTHWREALTPQDVTAPRSENEYNFISTPERLQYHESQKEYHGVQGDYHQSLENHYRQQANITLKELTEYYNVQWRVHKADLEHHQGEVRSHSGETPSHQERAAFLQTQMQTYERLARSPQLQTPQQLAAIHRQHADHHRQLALYHEQQVAPSMQQSALPHELSLQNTQRQYPPGGRGSSSASIPTDTTGLAGHYTLSPQDAQQEAQYPLEGHSPNTTPTPLGSTSVLRDHTYGSQGHLHGGQYQSREQNSSLAPISPGSNFTGGYTSQDFQQGMPGEQSSSSAPISPGSIVMGGYTSSPQGLQQETQYLPEQSSSSAFILPGSAGTGRGYAYDPRDPYQRTQYSWGGQVPSLASISSSSTGMGRGYSPGSQAPQQVPQYQPWEQNPSSTGLAGTGSGHILSSRDARPEMQYSSGGQGLSMQGSASGSLSGTDGMEPPSSRRRYARQVARIQATSVTPGERDLDPNYEVQNLPKKFFAFGRVFSVLWTEPTSSATGGTDEYTRVRFNEYAYSTIRRFVVVRESNDSCWCLPITSYGKRGILKPGVIAEDHAIIHTGTGPPKPMKGEKFVKAALQVETDSPHIKLDPTSRINFGKIYTVEHNIKVCKIGKIADGSQHLLSLYHRETCGT